MKVLFAASIIAAGFAISPASAAMMACTSENIAKCVAAAGFYCDGPSRNDCSGPSLITISAS